MDHYWTIAEAAEYLRLSVETLYKYVQRGVVPAAKVGRHWRFDKAAIDRWMAAQPQAGTPAPAVEAVAALRPWFPGSTDAVADVRAGSWQAAGL